MPSKPVPKQPAKPAAQAKPATSSSRRAALRRGGVGKAPAQPAATTRYPTPVTARPVTKAASAAAKPSNQAQPAAKPTGRAQPVKPAQPAAKPSSQAKPAAKMEKPDPGLLARMDALLAAFPAYRRPMFGTVSWFLEGNEQMFAAVWGIDVSLRIGAAEVARTVAAGKARPFAPMAGRTMREYVLVPASTYRDADLRKWIARAADFTGKLERKKGK